MKLRTTLTALACLPSCAGMAHAAQTIASAPLWTGLSHAGACYIRNVGTRPISVQISCPSSHEQLLQLCGSSMPLAPDG